MVRSLFTDWAQVSRRRLLVTLALSLLSVTCMRRVPMESSSLVPSCKQLKMIGGPPLSLVWTSPYVQPDRMKLGAWCDTVGPPILFAPQTPPSRNPRGRILVVNWNVGVGNGKVEQLIADLSKEEAAKGYAEPGFILLLQETFRRGLDVPSHLPDGSEVPRRIGHPADAEDIEQLARKLQWWMFYVPSMRNGRQVGSDAEDRGNAILSSLPLQDPGAVELPFEAQRRVALAATITDSERKLRVVTTHFDTAAPLLKGSIFGGGLSRKRQAMGLKAILVAVAADSSMSLILGGDLNTVGGRSEPAIGILKEVLPRLSCEEEKTHALGLTLDHMFADLADGWEATECIRWDQRLESDHHPLVFPLTMSS